MECEMGKSRQVWMQDHKESTKNLHVSQRGQQQTDWRSVDKVLILLF